MVGAIHPEVGPVGVGVGHERGGIVLLGSLVEEVKHFDGSVDYHLVVETVGMEQIAVYVSVGHLEPNACVPVVCVVYEVVGGSRGGVGIALLKGYGDLIVGIQREEAVGGGVDYKAVVARHRILLPVVAEYGGVGQGCLEHLLTLLVGLGGEFSAAEIAEVVNLVVYAEVLP